MSKLARFKVELEICAPIETGLDEVYYYMSALMSESDVSADNDVFAIGSIDVILEGDITVDEWNGDAVEGEVDD